MTPVAPGWSVHFVSMAAADAPRTRTRREKHPLALVESGPSDVTSQEESSEPLMAVSIAGVSTACSKDALASSAKAVRKTLSPE